MNFNALFTAAGGDLRSAADIVNQNITAGEHAPGGESDDLESRRLVEQVVAAIDADFVERLRRNREACTRIIAAAPRRSRAMLRAAAAKFLAAQEYQLERSRAHFRSFLDQGRGFAADLADIFGENSP